MYGPDVPASPAEIDLPARGLRLLLIDGFVGTAG